MGMMRFIPFFAAAAWGVRRMRGSEMRKHGGWQLWPPALAVWAAVGLLLLTSCDSAPIDPARRSNAQTASASAAQQQTESQPSPAPTQQVVVATPCPNGVVPPPTPDLIWCDAGVPNCRPTPDYKPAKYPCASNAEIDAWLQDDVHGSGK